MARNRLRKKIDNFSAEPEVEQLEPLAPQPGKQELALNMQADIIFYGGAAGSAKSYTALMRSLKHFHDPNYRPVYFRRTTKQLTGQGGLWPEAMSMYSRFKPKVNQSEHMIEFNSGARILFSHMEHENDAEKNHLGLQYSAIFFDELPTFTEAQFMFMISRLRSKANMSPYVFATMNPDYSSWVYNWVEWYIIQSGEKDGLPDESRCGVIRYFVIVDGKPKFADTREQLEKEYPHLCYIPDPKSGGKRYVPPKSFTFISANIFDNQRLLDTQPEYIASLMSQDTVTQQRMLHGNWKIRAQGNKYFSREWLQKAESVPIDAYAVRAWDKAASEPCDKEWRPDYTAGSPKMSKCRDGFYWLEWDFHPDIKDPDTEVTGRFRKTPGDRDKLIEKQANYDGKHVGVVLTQDTASAGKTEFLRASAELMAKGFVVYKDPIAHTTAKLSKFTPFSVAAKNGLVRIVESSFPNKETYEEWCKELESFSGEKSTRSRHDDWADAVASAFNCLAQLNYCPTVVINQEDCPSIIRDLLQDRDW